MFILSISCFLSILASSCICYKEQFIFHEISSSELKLLLFEEQVNSFHRKISYYQRKSITDLEKKLTDDKKDVEEMLSTFWEIFHNALSVKVRLASEVLSLMSDKDANEQKKGEMQRVIQEMKSKLEKYDKKAQDLMDRARTSEKIILGSKLKYPELKESRFQSYWFISLQDVDNRILGAYITLFEKYLLNVTRSALPDLVNKFVKVARPVYLRILLWSELIDIEFSHQWTTVRPKQLYEKLTDLQEEIDQKVKHQEPKDKAEEDEEGSDVNRNLEMMPRLLPTLSELETLQKEYESKKTGTSADILLTLNMGLDRTLNTKDNSVELKLQNLRHRNQEQVKDSSNLKYTNPIANKIIKEEQFDLVQPKIYINRDRFNSLPRSQHVKKTESTSPNLVSHYWKIFGIIALIIAGVIIGLAIFFLLMMTRRRKDNDKIEKTKI